MIVNGLPAYKRRYFRRIELHEDSKSVSRPEYHARGLIPFCLANPQLRIERRVGLLSNMMPMTSQHVDRRAEPPHGWNDGVVWIMVEESLVAIWKWIDEALHLKDHGMPLQCFKLTIDGSDRESQEVWDLIKHVAMLKEAMNAWGSYREKSPEPALYDPFTSSFSWPLPWHVPSHFPQTFREIMLGQNSIVRFPGTDTAPWDAQAFFEARKNWEEWDWRMEWRENVQVTGISTTFYRDLRARYRIEPETAG